MSIMIVVSNKDDDACDNDHHDSHSQENHAGKKKQGHGYLTRPLFGTFCSKPCRSQENFPPVDFFKKSS